MEVYGPGGIDDFLSIVPPESRDAESDPSIGGMACETATAELLWTEVPKEDGLAGAEPLVIAWGVDSGADSLCWDASGDDPAAWPVLVCKRGDGMWRRYDCGMVEFLLRVLRADFDECPLSDLSFWGVATVKFLTPSEESNYWRRDSTRGRASPTRTPRCIHPDDGGDSQFPPAANGPGLPMSIP